MLRHVLTLMLLLANLANAKWSKNTWEMTETLAHGYEGISQDFKNACPKQQFRNFCPSRFCYYSTFNSLLCHKSQFTGLTEEKKIRPGQKRTPYPLARQCASDTLWPASGFLSLYWLPAYLSILLLCKNTWTMVSPQFIKSKQSNRTVILQYWKDERMRWKKEYALKTNNWSYYAREKEK